MATSPINSFWNPNSNNTMQQQQYQQPTATFTNKHFYDPNNNSRIQVALPPGSSNNNETGGMALQLANVNPHLFLQGFRLRVCPTKPVPWDEIRRTDFNALRLSPPDLEKMRDLTLELIDAQFDANTVFGEVTVQTSGGGYTVKPVPSVGDVVALCRSLQAVLQFNLHSIQALKDQVRKQTIINQNFECELRRLTNDHVTQHAASARAKESQIIYLEERIAKLVADNTKLREALISAESNSKELAIEGSSAQLAWREERMRLQEENHALRQFVAGHGGGLDGDSRRSLFENILNGRIPNSGDVENKKSSRKSSSHRHHHHNNHHHDKKSTRPSSSSHNNNNNNKSKKCCDSVSCHKCGRGALRPIPFAIVNQQLPAGNPSPLAPPPLPPTSDPARAPREPTKEAAAATTTTTAASTQQQQHQQSTLLPYQAPSAMEQLRMQESIDTNRKRSDENFHKLENLVRNSNEELRTSIKNVGEVAHKSMQVAHDAENRHRSSNDQVADAVLKLRQSQQDSEAKVLGVLQQNDNQLRQQIDKMGVKLQKETKAVADSVDGLSRRVGNLEQDVDKLKNAPAPAKHISIALKDSRVAEYPQLPPPQQVSPSKLPRQQHHDQGVEDEQQSNKNASKSAENNLYPSFINNNTSNNNNSQRNTNPDGVQPPRQPGQTYAEKVNQQQQHEDDTNHDVDHLQPIDPKLVVVPMTKNNNNNNNNNINNMHSQNVQISLISASYKPEDVSGSNNNNNNFVPPPPPPPPPLAEPRNQTIGGHRGVSPSPHDFSSSKNNNSNININKSGNLQKTPPREESNMNNSNIQPFYQPHEHKQKRRGPDDSETLSTTDNDDSFQLRRRQKRSARKELEKEEQEHQILVGNTSFVDNVKNNENFTSFRRDPDEDHLVDDGIMLVNTPFYRNDNKPSNISQQQQQGRPAATSLAPVPENNVNGGARVYISPKKNDHDDDDGDESEDEFGEKKSAQQQQPRPVPVPIALSTPNKPESALDKIKRELAELEALG